MLASDVVELLLVVLVDVVLVVLICVDDVAGTEEQSLQQNVVNSMPPIYPFEGQFTPML